MTGPKKKNGTKNIDKRLGVLRSELDALQGDMKGLAGDVTDIADGRVHLAVRAHVAARRAVAGDVNIAAGAHRWEQCHAHRKVETTRRIGRALHHRAGHVDGEGELIEPRH